MTTTRHGVLIAAALTLAACAGSSDATDSTASPGTGHGTAATETSAAAGTGAAPGTAPEKPGPKRATTTSAKQRRPATGNHPTQVTSVESSVRRVPLTGAPLGPDRSAPDRPALVVKIDNTPPAIPQTGLNEADLVFEEIIEYGITRFAAVFQSQGSNPVGPIRSGRTQDVDMLGALNQPLFAWSGGNPGVTKAIEDSDLVNLNAQHTPGYFRTTDRPAPSNLYATTDALWALAAPEAPLPGAMFRYLDPGEPLGKGLSVAGAAGAEMFVGSMRARWEWRPESQTYGRVQNGTVHDTATTGQVNTTNVVLLKMEYRPSPVDARSPEAQTIGEGKAWVLSGGKLIAGHWVRDTRTDMFFLYQGVGAEETPIKLQPGRTFVELMDQTAPDPQFL